MEQTSKKTTRTTVTAYSLGSSTLAVHDWPLFTLKFGVLSSLLVECIAAAKYSDRRSPTPRPTQRSASSTPSAPSTAKPHAFFSISQRAQHGQTPRPTPRPTQPEHRWWSPGIQRPNYWHGTNWSYHFDCAGQPS